MTPIASLAELEAIYGQPGETSLAKEIDRLNAEYRAYVEASPFVALATAGPEGLDCSPRGDAPGLVRVIDERTLVLPDRRGNNRIDSLKNVLRDPRVALLFLVPGIDNTLRINGRAQLTADKALLESFAVEGKAPRTALVIAIERVYFQCSRALMRSSLWDPARHRSPKDLPSAGEMLAAATAGRVGGAEYDRAWPERAKASMW
jgi:PPOX class probable FMN-dependent enzyme